jgi:hypothetical protein
MRRACEYILFQPLARVLTWFHLSRHDVRATALMGVPAIDPYDPVEHGDPLHEEAPAEGQELHVFSLNG